ncbi:MAG: hypothetical protein ACT4PL_03610 [Phycisphaerales bacterium]
MARLLMRVSVTTLLLLAGAGAAIGLIPAAREAAADKAAELTELVTASLRKVRPTEPTPRSDRNRPEGPRASGAPQAPPATLPAPAMVAASAEAHAAALEHYLKTAELTAALGVAVAKATPETLPTLGPEAARLLSVERELSLALEHATAVNGRMVEAARSREGDPALLTAATERALMPAALARLAEIARNTRPTLPPPVLGPTKMERDLLSAVEQARTENAALRTRAEKAEGTAEKMAAEARSRGTANITPALRREFDTLENALTMERDRNTRAEQVIAGLRAEAAAQATKPGPCVQCLQERIMTLERELANAKAQAQSPGNSSGLRGTTGVRPNPPPAAALRPLTLPVNGQRR